MMYCLDIAGIPVHCMIWQSRDEYMVGLWLDGCKRSTMLGSCTHAWPAAGSALEYSIGPFENTNRHFFAAWEQLMLLARVDARNQSFRHSSNAFPSHFNHKSSNMPAIVLS